MLLYEELEARNHDEDKQDLELIQAQSSTEFPSPGSNYLEEAVGDYHLEHSCITLLFEQYPNSFTIFRCFMCPRI